MKPTLLIVEDEPFQRENLLELLEDNYNLHFAENGKEAISIFQEHHSTIDLILLDIYLPDMSGDTILKTLLTQIPQASVIKLIVMSAYTQESDMIKKIAAKIPGYQYLEKPFTKKDLFNTIENGLLKNS